MNNYNKYANKSVKITSVPGSTVTTGVGKSLPNSSLGFGTPVGKKYR